MNLDEAINRFNLAINMLRTEIPKQVEISANDAIQMITERTQERGVDFENHPFSPYSPEYKARKQKAGKYSGHVDMTWSGEMMRSIGIVDEKVGPGDVRITVSGRDEHSRMLLSVNSDRRKPIIAVTRSEQRILENNFEAGLTDKLRKLFT